MKVYHGRTDIERFEHLVETPSQTVTHLVLPAGQAIGQHHVPYTEALNGYRRKQQCK